jgi:hypothetical protein
MERLRVGGTIIYVDEHARQHEALVTAIWGDPKQNPCINVVLVNSDEAMQDCYGRQITRETSVVYKVNQPAHGRYYMFPGEEPNPVAQLQS